MEELNTVTEILALTMGVAWASGINLYAAILVLGIMSTTGNLVLPDQLAILSNPVVMGIAGILFLVEFFADKIPAVDTLWDSIHTFIRIPAGAVLAAGMVGDVSPVITLGAALLGGTISAGTHAAKAGTRAVANTSPEPISNWTLSITEDVAVVGGLWAALNYPLIFLSFLVLFLLFLIWFLPRVWKLIRNTLGFVFRKISRSADPKDQVADK